MDDGEEDEPYTAQISYFDEYLPPVADGDEEAEDEGEGGEDDEPASDDTSLPVKTLMFSVVLKRITYDVVHVPQ